MLRLLWLILLVAGIILLVVFIVLFSVFKIPKTLRELKGTYAKKEIEYIRNNAMEMTMRAISGNLMIDSNRAEVENVSDIKVDSSTSEIDAESYIKSDSTESTSIMNYDEGTGVMEDYTVSVVNKNIVILQELSSLG